MAGRRRKAGRKGAKKKHAGRHRAREEALRLIFRIREEASRAVRKRPRPGRPS